MEETPEMHLQWQLRKTNSPSLCQYLLYHVSLIVIHGAARHFWKDTWTNCSVYKACAGRCESLSPLLTLSQCPIDSCAPAIPTREPEISASFLLMASRRQAAAHPKSGGRWNTVVSVVDRTSPRAPSQKQHPRQDAFMTSTHVRSACKLGSIHRLGTICLW